MAHESHNFGPLSNKESKTNICVHLHPRGVHSLLYFAYMCVWDLFIGGLFTLQKRFFKIKINACILIHHIGYYKFLGESFKNTLIYLYYIFFLIFQIYVKSSIQVFSTKNTSFHPLAQTLSQTRYP
jgi:hypothetical protein